MTSRGDMDRLQSANDRLVAMALRDMKALLEVISPSTPGELRDALLELAPALVREYGDVAAAASAEWFEEVRPMGGFSAVAAAGTDPEAVAGSVKALFKEDPAQVVEALSGAIQRHILYSSRATIARNVELDPAKPRFARVPSGRETCAWCDMLASRGWVYHSRETAGDRGFKQFHDDDECMIVPQWDQDTAHIEGYDPDAMYDRYMAARASLEAEGRVVDDAAVAVRMGQLFPDSYPTH